MNSLRHVNRPATHRWHDGRSYGAHGSIQRHQPCGPPVRRARRRVVRTHAFERHVRRGTCMRSQFEAGWVPFGFLSVTLLTRAGTSGGLRIMVS